MYLPGGQEFHVTKGTGEVAATRYYSFAGQTVAVRTGQGMGAVTSIVADAHGTALAAVPNTLRGGTINRLYTDPFGGQRTTSRVDLFPGDRQFLGKTRDDQTGLTLLDARYYDEVVGRFVSVDPQLDAGSPAQFNAYVYSGNNPLTWSDPSGLSWLSSLGSGISKAWNATTGFVDKYQAEIVGGPRLAGADDDGTLFLTVDGTGFSLDRLTQLVRDHVTASGVGKQGACHLFRHTLATLMLEGGADIRYIQAMLGHAELSTTQIYTQVSIRALQAVHTATFPAATTHPLEPDPLSRAPVVG